MYTVLFNVTRLKCNCCFHKGNDATSIPSQCCAYPYTLDGGLYYNCTVNQAVSNDFGCYHANGQWVKCQQPESMYISLWSPYVIWQTIIFSSCCFFFLSIYLSVYLFSSPNLSRRRGDVCHTCTHGVALVRI